MTKQEEIREGMLKIARKYRNLYEGRAELLVEELRDYLQKNGVAIKMDSELPTSEFAYDIEASWVDIRRNGQEDMLKAGYVATELLLDKS